MEGHCSTGQSLKRVVAPMEEKEEDMRPLYIFKFNIHGTVHRSMTSSNNQRDAA